MNVGIFPDEMEKGVGDGRHFHPHPRRHIIFTRNPRKKGGGPKALVVSTVGARRARVGYLSALVPRPLGYLPFEREGRPERGVEVPRVAPDVLRVVENDFGVGGYLVPR